MFKLFVCLLVLEYGVLAQQNSECDCDNCVPFKDEKCFKIITSMATEEEAEGICQKFDKNSVLAIIKTKEEQEVITNYININAKNKFFDNIWIGVKRSNNTFKLSDGTNLKYSNWDKERPLNDDSNLNCVQISVDPTNYGKWIDESCMKRNAILCQKLQVWSISKIQTILMDTKRDLIEELELQRSEIDYLKKNPVPIGFIYVQLSTQSEPQILWPNTKWENISPKYAGLFFRTEGGQSNEFGKIQEQLTQSIDFQTVPIGRNHGKDYNHGPTPILNNNQLPVFTGAPNDAQWYGILLKHNNEEIRPRNYAIRIWLRIK